MTDETIDVYRIARLLHAENGTDAARLIKDKIQSFSAAGDANAVKIWYEIEAALEEIESAKVTELV